MYEHIYRALQANITDWDQKIDILSTHCSLRMISIKVAKKRPRKSAADDDEDYNDDVDGIRHDDHDIRADDMKIGGKRGKKVPIPSKGKTKKGSFGGRGK